MSGMNLFTEVDLLNLGPGTKYKHKITFQNHSLDLLGSSLILKFMI